jgi:superfamily II DNA or RNA helicase
MESSLANDELALLRAENARLVALLESKGIEWRAPSPPAVFPTHAVQFTSHDKVALFRKLFRSRTDVYPQRWESKSSGKSGYSPACANEWREGVCEKPRIRCSECAHRLPIPLSDTVIFKHLTGELTIGVYPLLEDETCCFLAVDFDEAEWREDARAFMHSCAEVGVPAALEISRSGAGAHVWIFFAAKVSARDARRLGAALISQTCARTRQLALTSYDRLFPNQDAMPKGGIGNLIALPLQKHPRAEGRSVFVDVDFVPYADQWGFLASIAPMAPTDLEATILRAAGDGHVLDVTPLDEDEVDSPWRGARDVPDRLPGPLPESLTVTLANQVYFVKAQLPQTLTNRLIRLAAFQNPEFYKAQAMRLSVWDKPRIIGRAENYPKHIALPRGCLDAATVLLSENGIRMDLVDERNAGASIDVRFSGSLRSDQEEAVAAMLANDAGVLSAPTAFGKTVVAAALIARRSVNTLILVHRTELMTQWQERLSAFLGGDKRTVGVIGGGKSKPTGIVDVAVMQSLSRQGEVDPIVASYGHVIVDECHHVGATSFDALLKHATAKYVLGLTATPMRRDGLHPMIFMQCGPIRHRAGRPAQAPADLVVIPRCRSTGASVPADTPIQDLFRSLAVDSARTQAIADEVFDAFGASRKVLVLTERTDHLDAIAQALVGRIPAPFVLHGRMSKRQRTDLQAALNALTNDAPRVLLSTGKLVGEGFDHPALDTLVLAMPVSWKGTLQQYAGRLHRDHVGKSSVRIIDFVDGDHPTLLRMWDKRRRGYRAMGYRIEEASDSKGLPSGS